MSNTTTKLSDQITGNDYFSCYRSRMQVNDSFFKQIAAELAAMGCEVYASKSGLISYIKVKKDGKHIYFGFTDVPYRWDLSYDIDYRLKKRER